MKAQEEKKIFHIKAYKKKELTKVLNLTSEYEFDKITKPYQEKIGKRIGHYYTPKQVRIILDLILTFNYSLIAPQILPKDEIFVSIPP